MSDLRIIWSMVRFPCTVALMFCAMFTITVYGVSTAYTIQQSLIK